MRYVLLIIIIALVLLALSFLIPFPSKEPASNVIQSELPMKKTSSLTLTSSAFSEGASIPSEYTCEGANTSPPLSWSGVPESTKSLALTMYDPDVPKVLRPEGFFDHWTLYGLSPTETGLAAASTAGNPGKNGAGKLGYTGPCPPAQFEPSEHRYIFTLYALDTDLNLPDDYSRADLEAAIAGHILGQASLMGRYKKLSP